MPELPEVEAARRAIEEHCLGKRIKKSVVADDTKVIDGVSAAEFEASIAGKTIVNAHRKGKNLWLQLDSPPFPSFQFGMTGAVYIKGVAVTKYERSAVNDDDEWPSKYSKVFIELDDGVEFSFTDKRRFARVRLLEDPTSVPPISELGPDALLEPMSKDEFVASLSKKKIGIKALLLDQGYISGIGNWIADEVLYQARIHPQQDASSLSIESCATLQKCIKKVVHYAVQVDAESGRFPVEWLFHFRWGKKPGTVNDSSQYPNKWIFHSREKKHAKAFVDGNKIEFITAAGRTTAFVPELQKLRAPSQSRKQSKKRKGRKDDNDDDIDELENEVDNAKNTKAKKGVKSKRQAEKKLPAKRKLKGSGGGDHDAPESDAENTRPKKWTKGKGQVEKKRPAKKNLEESGDDDYDESESDAENTKPKKGTKDKGQVKKKLPAKRKAKISDNEQSDNEEGDDGSDEHTKPKKGMKPKSQPKKKLAGKAKSRGGEDGTDGDEDKIQMKKSKKGADDKQTKAEKTTKKPVQSSQNN